MSGKLLDTYPAGATIYALFDSFNSSGASVTLTGLVTGQAWIVWLPFLFWFLAVYGHILRHAFNVTLGIGLLLATGYVLLSLMVTGPFLLAEAPAE